MNRNKINYRMTRSLSYDPELLTENACYEVITDEVEVPHKYLKENSWIAGMQMSVAFLLAGFGMVAASLLLDTVQHWDVFTNVSEVYILVPALLGLKGNLEMTLASRLSTHAHMGHLDINFGSLVANNLCLIQCQAILVGFLAAMAAVTMGWIPEGHFDIHHALLLCSSSVLTAASASLILSLIMIGVIVTSKKMYINPDNVATPIAASLGDLTTLALLSWIASYLYKSMDTSVVLPSTIIVTGVILVPTCGYKAWKNDFTRQALRGGWVPVLCAMVISSAGGVILDHTVSLYSSIAVYQLVINGIGGNMAAVHASRLSTQLHTGQRAGNFFGKTTRFLLLMVVPGQLIFLNTIEYLRADHTPTSPTFILIYMSAALTQVFLLLAISHYIVVWTWKMGMDPDDTAIPFLTALGDLLGTSLLGLAFSILHAIGDNTSGTGE